MWALEAISATPTPQKYDDWGGGGEVGGLRPKVDGVSLKSVCMELAGPDAVHALSVRTD